MQYLDSPQPGLKYVGQVADGYDAKRMDDPKWKIEQEIIERLLSDLPRGSWVVDAPVGTGRFFHLYAKNDLIVRGIDISEDMLKKAAAKIGGQSRVMQLQAEDGQVIQTPQFELIQGDLTQPLPPPDKSVDAAVCVRITRWLSPQECQNLFKELQRICRDRIILTARVANHQHARPVQMFEAVMSDDWQLEHSIAGYQPEYRVLQFRCKNSPLLGSRMIDAKAEPEHGDAWTMKPYEAA
jgi:ubiquinone/menaquinone biosynthesis C-methylase UbiE